MKTGLILEGGAMRGLFSAAVTDQLMDWGIAPDGIIGVSAGACFGCNMISKQPGRALRYNLAYCKDPRYCSFRSWIATGNLYGKEMCYETIPNHLDPFDYEAFRMNKTPFYVVATDVETGKAVYHLLLNADGENMEWIRASASMPLFSNMVEIEGKKYLDGGIADSIPVRFFQEIGYEKNIVILTQPRSYRKQEMKGMKVFEMLYHRYPAFIETMKKRAEKYNETLDYIRKQEEEGKLFVIAPPEKLPVNHIEHKPGNIQKAYDIGKEVIQQKKEALFDFLNR